MPSIELNISTKLADEEYRREFFLAEASAQIAQQLIQLRKQRGLSQTALAEKIGTKQSGISRVESADYSNWSFNTLRKIAEVLDARLRVVIEPAEAILHEYAEPIEGDSSVWDRLARDKATDTAQKQSQGASVLTAMGKTRNEADLSGSKPSYFSGANSRHQGAAIRA